MLPDWRWNEPQRGDPRALAYITRWMLERGEVLSGAVNIEKRDMTGGNVLEIRKQFVLEI